LMLTPLGWICGRRRVSGQFVNELVAGGPWAALWRRREKVIKKGWGKQGDLCGNLRGGLVEAL